MSKYVNLSLDAKEKDLPNALLKSRTKGGDIVVNPSIYSIGVSRMKVPLSGIPLMRLYNDTFLLGFSARSSLLYTNTGLFNPHRNKKMTTAEMAQNFSGDVEWATPHKSKVLPNLFPNCIPNRGIDPLNDRTYHDIHSQEEICEVLNLAVLRSIGNIAEMEQGHQFKGATNAANVVLGFDNIAENFINGGVAAYDIQGKTLACATFQEARHDDATASISSQHDYISSINITIGSMTAVSVAIGGFTTHPDLSNYSLWLSRTPINTAGTVDTPRFNTGDYDTWCIMKNCFNHLDDGNITHTIIFSTELGETTTREQKNGKNFQAFRNNTSAGSDYVVALDFAVAKDIIGKRYDGYKYECYFVNEAVLRNATSGPATANAQTPHFIIPATEFVCRITTSKFGNVRAAEPYSGGSNAYQNPSLDADGNLDTNWKLAPYFSWDKASQKISFNISNDYLLSRGYDMYMNENLAELFSFERYKVDDIKYTHDLDKYFYYLELPENGETYTKGIELASVYKGSVFSFKPQYGDMGENRNDKSNWYSMCKYEEEMITSWRRDWLNGIVVLSNSLAIDGEIVGDGSVSRKIITDFQIDPSTTGRDYLIYFNTGGMRLYELNSTSPLKNIEIGIYYQTIYGDIRPLPITKLSECQVKLEFRPNAMIYGLSQDVSAFDFK